MAIKGNKLQLDINEVWIDLMKMHIAGRIDLDEYLTMAAEITHAEVMNIGEE